MKVGQSLQVEAGELLAGIKALLELQLREVPEEVRDDLVGLALDLSREITVTHTAGPRGTVARIAVRPGSRLERILAFAQAMRRPQ